jgi:hypothetical protein
LNHAQPSGVFLTHEYVVHGGTFLLRHCLGTFLLRNNTSKPFR